MYVVTTIGMYVSFETYRLSSMFVQVREASMYYHALITLRDNHIYMYMLSNVHILVTFVYSEPSTCK